LCFCCRATRFSTMSTLATRLAEKKKELEYLQQLQIHSKGLVGELEGLADKLNVLSGGTECKRNAKGIELRC
jgi:hypothetical protein